MANNELGKIEPGNMELVNKIQQAREGFPMNQIKAEKASTIRKETMVPEGKVPGCIDDRLGIQIEGVEKTGLVTTKEELNGPKFLGGSLSVNTLALETMPEEMPGLEFEEMFAIVKEAHELAGLEVGVHMDNHHGHWSESETAAVINNVFKGEGDEIVLPGCGYAGLLIKTENPLGLGEKSQRFYKKYPNIVDRYVRAGSRLTVLDQEHAKKDDAMAVEEMTSSMVVDKAKALAAGVQTYDHATGTLSKLTESLAMVCEKKSGVWAKNIRESAMAINDKHLKITTNILAGMDPIKLD